MIHRKQTSLHGLLFMRSLWSFLQVPLKLESILVQYGLYRIIHCTRTCMVLFRLISF